MTNSDDRHPENVPGRFHVNEDCIICDMCFNFAPATFRESEDGNQSIVYQQPTTTEEVSAAEEALEECPVGAIQSSA